jgi:hypothetical protein
MGVELEFMNAIHDGIRDGVKSKLGGYNSPLDKMISELLLKHDSLFRDLLESAITSAMKDDTFREQVRHKLGSVLVARFGGELEKQVNMLKSDPATRARITLAIEQIVKERTTAV